MKNNFRQILLMVIIVFFWQAAYGSFESFPRSTINTGFGKLTLNSNGNFIDIINEPGSLIRFNNFGGEAIWNKPFQIDELQQTAFAVGMPYKNWGIGLGASSFGNKIYNENIFFISAASSFKQKLDYGISGIVYQLKIESYGVDHVFGLNTSIRYRLNEKWNWVSTARNINFPKIGSTNEILPQIITTGFIGEVHEGITVATEWEQDIDFTGSLKFGILVQPLDQLLISCGYVSNPGQFTAGLSININKLYFEYGTIAYTDLGLFTHQLGIGFNISCR